jgi:hypothetical protein
LESCGYNPNQQSDTPQNKFKAGSQQYIHDTTSFEHDHVALFWECQGKDRDSLELFCKVFDSVSKISFGARRGPLKDIPVNFKPFYDLQSDNGLYGFMFKVQRDGSYEKMAALFKQVINATRIVSTEDMDFGRSTLRLYNQDIMNSQYTRIQWAMNSGIFNDDYERVELPTSHTQKPPSMVSIGDTVNLPRLADVV